MRVAIMQPYFLPYIGYFQLIRAADIFIVYDNIKYTKKGWINRNRFLLNGADAVFTLPLAKGSDSLDVVQRELSPSFDAEALLCKFRGAYCRAPYVNETLSLLEGITRFKDRNLFRYIKNSIDAVCAHLEAKTTILVSSELQIDHSLRGVERVIAMCKEVGADTYLNPIGGVSLYRKEDFDRNNLNILFVNSKIREYQQFSTEFVPSLSIIDVLMFSPLGEVRRSIIEDYELIYPRERA